MKWRTVGFRFICFTLNLCLSWAQTSNTFIAPQMNIIILILGEDPNYGYYATGPMYDVAFRHVDQMYPGLFANTTRHVLYKRNVMDCSSAAANMVELVGQVIGLVDRFSGPTILFSPGCSLEVTPLADVARELNLLLLASTSSDVAFMNKQRFPTFVSFCPTGKGGQVPGLILFLKKYDWTTISVFCESLTNYFNVASVFGLHCRAIRNFLMTPSSGFTVYYQDFDTVKNPGTDIFRYLLLRAQFQSRIIIVESREDVVRRFMIQAYLLNMTNGDYVFLYPEPNKIPSYISPLDETDHHDDKLAKEAYKAMILLQFDDWGNDRTIKTFQEAALTSKTHYNYTYRADELVNDDSLAAYEAVNAFALVLQDIISSNRSITMLNFRQRLVNRTFVTDARNVTIGADAYRQVNTLFRRFDNSLQEFTTGWTYNSPAGRIEVTSSQVSSRWHGRAGPPSSIPPCGFDGRSCKGLTNQGKVVLKLSVGVVTGTCVLLAIVGIFIHRTLQPKIKEEGQQFWTVDISRLIFRSERPASRTAAEFSKYFRVN